MINAPKSGTFKSNTIINVESIVLCRSLSIISALNGMGGRAPLWEMDGGDIKIT